MNDPAATGVAARPSRRALVLKLKGALEHADPGTLAALRRADPASPPPAFYRLTADLLDDYLPEAGPFRDREETRWAVVLGAMAHAVQFLEPKRTFGEALGKAKVAEMRVLRLLEAREEQLYDLVRQVVHQLVQKGQTFDPCDIADLVLARDERAVRRRIARDFYRHHADS